MKIDKYVTKMQKNDKTKELPWPVIVRKAIVATFWSDLLYATLFSTIAEAITVTYIYFLFYMFQYIKDESICPASVIVL